MLEIQIKNTTIHRENPLRRIHLVDGKREIYSCDLNESQSSKLAEEMFNSSLELNYKRFKECVAFNHITHNKHNYIIDILFKYFAPNVNNVIKSKIINNLEEKCDPQDIYTEEEIMESINLILLES